MARPAYLYTDMPVRWKPLAPADSGMLRGGLPAMKWYFHACPVCGGDLHDDLEDHGWVSCFMCARSFKASEVRLDNPDDNDDRVGYAETKDLSVAA